MKQINLLFLLALSIFLHACASDDDTAERSAELEARQQAKIEQDLRFFPLQLGHANTYQVDSFVFNDFTETIDTYYYESQSVISDTFRDNLADLAYQWDFYQRRDSTRRWQLQKRGFVNDNSPQDLHWFLDNRRYIAFNWPVEEGKSWDGNAYNRSLRVNYTYHDVYENFDVGRKTYDSTVRVTKAEEESLINQFREFEVYAKDVGRIYRLKDSLNLDFETGDTVSGYILIYRIKE